MRFNPIDYPICLEEIGRLLGKSWSMHLPFGLALVQMVKPRIIVELGTFQGESYCAFCQSVKRLGLDTRCYAVDTWRGDGHSGFYRDDVINDLRAHHDPLYSGFSTLISGTFDDAIDKFQDGEIDLLHIDGAHTYEAASHDFHTWLPKISARGIVMLHDINEHQRDFGVWRLWAEMADKYPHFEFKYGHGLGIIAVGAEIPGETGLLFNADAEEAEAISQLFYRLGRGHVQRIKLEKEVARLRREGLFVLPALKKCEGAVRKTIIKPLKNLIGTSGQNSPS